jgi:pimeloyl-ACP methyl ester carboxylesterase
LGVEQIALYRAEVLNARAVAARGIPVLRYHARGHGDSSGDFSAVSFEGLVEDARAAAREARRRAERQAIAWLGVRFGGLVAARAATQEPDSCLLALWEPTHHPPDYFRGQLRGHLFSQVAEGRRPDATVDQLLERLERDGRLDVHGYYLHRTIVESSRGEDLTRSLASWTGSTFIAQIANRGRLTPATSALVAALEARGVRVASACIRDEPGWHFTQNPAWENSALVRATAEWLDALG